MKKIERNEPLTHRNQDLGCYREGRRAVRRFAKRRIRQTRVDTSVNWEETKTILRV